MEIDAKRAGATSDPLDAQFGPEELADAPMNEREDLLDVDDSESSDEYSEPDMDFDDLLGEVDAEANTSSRVYGVDGEKLTKGQADLIPLLPADFHKHGIPIGNALLHFNHVYRARYSAGERPLKEDLMFCPRALPEAVEEAFRDAGNDGGLLPASERCFLVLYLHKEHNSAQPLSMDNSIRRNLFPHCIFNRPSLIAELLIERCVLWGWDVTTPDNMAMLEQQMSAAEAAGLSRRVWEGIEGVPPQNYPLLIVVKDRDCAGTELTRGSWDYAETAQRLEGVIHGLTDTELQAQLDTDAEIARRLDEQERANAAWIQRPPGHYPPYQPHALLADTWATSPPYPDDESIPLWRDERGCVDDRRLVKAVGLVGAQLPPANARSAHVVVKFNNVNVIAPMQATFELLTFHDDHLSLSSAKRMPYEITIAYSDVKRLFFLRGDELRIGYFMIQHEKEGVEGFVVMKLYRVQEAVKLEVDLGAEGGGTLPRNFVDAVNGGSLSAEEAPIFERIAGVLQLLCRKPLIVSHGFAAENAKPLIFCSIPASTGFLYPLDAGLAFISIAPHFISYDEIADNGVELRAVDGKPDAIVVTVSKKDGIRLNYSNLHQQDAALLKTYLDERAADGSAR